MVLGAGTILALEFSYRTSSLTKNAGPAHAVYFATYEVVKHAMGGNMGNEHHPLAAGETASKDFGDGSKSTEGELIRLQLQAGHVPQSRAMP